MHKQPLCDESLDRIVMFHASLEDATSDTDRMTCVLQYSVLNLLALCTVYTVGRSLQKDMRAWRLTTGIDCLSNQIRILTGASHA